MPIITCPHCGTKRNTPQAKLPSKPTNARCPGCQQPFAFNPADHQPTAAEKPHANDVTCPHCGLQRAIPSSRLTIQSKTINCRRCQRSFRQPADTKSQSKDKTLRSIDALLADSWELFCHRGWGLLTIYLLGSLLTAAPLLTVIYLFADKLLNNQTLGLSSLLLGSTYGLFSGSWMIASMFFYLCRPELSIGSAIGSGLRKVWSFAVILVLLSLVIAGASLLLIIPGIIFCGWFFFCHYILADEGIGGLQAMEKSRLLVRGHWWALGNRMILLLLVVTAFAVLSARLPIIGTQVNFAFSLLLTPFSLIYCYLIYSDLKKNYHGPQRPSRSAQWLPLTTALLGWLLIPGLILVNNYRKTFIDYEFNISQKTDITQLLNDNQENLASARETSQPNYPEPEKLTLADYDRLLAKELGETKLSPGILTAEQFWTDTKAPHLWLKLQIASLPNLGLSQQRSARILIDHILDATDQDHYNRKHSFEDPAFHWVNITKNSESDEISGVRNVYLNRGTQPEQIRSISGQLEINLPLGIESLHLQRSDIGKTLQVAGKTLTLETINKDGVTLRFHGKRSELLSIRATNQQAEPLREAGMTWQRIDEALSFRQMFNGNIDNVTILVASDSVTRSYPFELSQ